MHSDYDNFTYKHTANKCYEFSPCEYGSTFSTALGEGNGISCLNCEHFAEKHCDMDLYDDFDDSFYDDF